MSDRISDKRVAPELANPTNAVRQGVTVGAMRWVLGISLALVVIAFSILYALHALP